MTSRQVAMEVLLWVASITTALCCLGVAVMKDLFEKLHYMGTVATIAAFTLLGAVLLQEGWGQAGTKMILICGVTFLMNAVLTHATARAARVRKLGHWTPDPEEHIKGKEGVGGEQHQQERRRNE
jgi:multisubunit Na+/H+ antiporter MnhG subunit